MKNRLKKIFLLILFFVISALAENSWAGTCDRTTCFGAAPWTAASPSRDDVDHCVNVCASAGDTVIVPAGSATWTYTPTYCDHQNQKGGICINKGVNLLGAGIGKTVITSNLTNASAMIVYHPDFNLNTPFRVSGFSFDVAGKNSGIFLGEWAKSAGSPPFTIQTNIRIDHNHFYSTSPPPVGMHALDEMGGMYGVVDNNTVEGFCLPFSQGMGVMNSSYWNAWQTTGWEYKPGDPYVLYHENNTITFGPCIDRPDNPNVTTDCAYSGRYVYRYNTINLSNNADPLFDLHGNYPFGDQGNGVVGMWACFGAEIYGNLVNLSGYTSYMNMRDGKTLIMYNSNAGGVSYFNECDSDQQPVTYPPGQDMRQSYWFNNRSGLTGDDQGSALLHECVCTDHCTDPVANTNFWQYSAAFNGTSGVGCGTLANRPLSCTPGVGYWATNQSCTNLAGLVGTNVGTPISGTLYRCMDAGNNWEAYYTPYPYPHPLRTDCDNHPTLCDPDSTPPAEPRGLSVK